MKLICKEKNIYLSVERADTFLKRFFGLMGRNDFEEDKALLLEPCSSIHTFFMKFTIDVYYISKDNVVLYKETLKPWKVGKIVSKSKKILELKTNSVTNIEVGDMLEL